VNNARPELGDDRTPAAAIAVFNLSGGPMLALYPENAG
jgi:hypothetical protein